MHELFDGNCAVAIFVQVLHEHPNLALVQMQMQIFECQLELARIQLTGTVLVYFAERLPSLQLRSESVGKFFHGLTQKRLRRASSPSSGLVRRSSSRSTDWTTWWSPSQRHRSRPNWRFGSPSMNLYVCRVPARVMCVGFHALVTPSVARQRRYCGDMVGALSDHSGVAV